jgi:hypothetical protein
LSSYGVLDGGFLFDPLANPLSFYYSLTTNGGSLTGSNSVFTLTAIGGNLKVYYQDLKNYRYNAEGNLAFCDSNVTFDFSNFDQSRSKIRSIVFYPDNSEKIKTFNSKIIGQSLIYPSLSSSNSVYYPKEKFYTIYKPKFIVNYDDGTAQTITSTLSVIQCGLIDTYKNKSMLESVPYFKELNSVAIFVNDKSNNNLLVSLLDVKSPFVFDTSELDTVELPFSVAPIPLNSINPLAATLQAQLNPSVPVPPTNQNPSTPPTAVYRYGEGFGITLNPNPSDLVFDESFSIANQSIILSIGGAPYGGSDSVTIVVS